METNSESSSGLTTEVYVEPKLSYRNGSPQKLRCTRTSRWASFQLREMPLAWSCMTHFYNDYHMSQKPVKTQLTKMLCITDACFVQSLIPLFS